MPRSPSRRPRPRRPADADASTAALAVAWRGWLVENLLAGVAPARLVDGLVARGVPPARARREVAATAASPLLPVCGELTARARRLELAHALCRAHDRHDPAPTAVPRRTTPPAEVFFRDHWAAHRPVVLTDATAGWPARTWTPAWFRARFGRVRVEVTTGREADPEYDANVDAHRTSMTMARFIDRVLAAGHSNDLYLVANNRALERPALRPLLAGLRPPPDLFHPPGPTGCSLWIGPAGTITPLHHDTTNILFCQLHGRKRIELVSPSESALLGATARGFYSTIDLDRRADHPHPAVRALQVREVVLAPGEALFLPAGWWHRVTALDVSISLSLLSWRRPNDFDWYRPGA